MIRKDLDEKLKHGLVRYLLEDKDTRIAMLHKGITSQCPADVKVFMNPSIAFYGNKLLFSIRGVNYILYNSRKFPVMGDQLTVYINNDNALKSTNFIGIMNPDTLEIKDCVLIYTDNFDTDPLWEFQGLEDGRLLLWNNKIYLSGDRRDTDTQGTGRIELSGIEYLNKSHKAREVSRTRISISSDSYCEKNWMPFADKPEKWMRDITENEIVDYSECQNFMYKIGNSGIVKKRSRFPLRGSSQFIPDGKNYYGIAHDCSLECYNEKTNARNGTYRHYIIETDMEGKIIDCSRPFTFSDGDFNVEFCCGLAFKDDFGYISFSENDSIPLVMKFKKNMLFD